MQSGTGTGKGNPTRIRTQNRGILRSLLARAHGRLHVLNVRDFPQTKLDNGINSPFLLNEHSDPLFFCQVFAKNSLMKNIFEDKKKFDSRK